MSALKRTLTFAEVFREAQKSPAYWADWPATTFAEDLAALLERRHMSRAALARRLGVSPPWITKVLRGDANLTLRTMAKIGMALNATVRVRLVPR